MAGKIGARDPAAIAASGGSGLVRDFRPLTPSGLNIPGPR
jgi:hypothetical protein